MHTHVVDERKEIFGYCFAERETMVFRASSLKMSNPYPTEEKHMKKQLENGLAFPRRKWTSSNVSRNKWIIRERERERVNGIDRHSVNAHNESSFAWIIDFDEWIVSGDRACDNHCSLTHPWDNVDKQWINHLQFCPRWIRSSSSRSLKGIRSLSLSPRMRVPAEQCWWQLHSVCVWKKRILVLIESSIDSAGSYLMSIECLIHLMCLSMAKYFHNKIRIHLHILTGKSNTLDAMQRYVYRMRYLKSLRFYCSISTSIVPVDIIVNRFESENSIMPF